MKSVLWGAMCLLATYACAQTTPVYPHAESSLGQTITRLLADDPVAARAHWGVAVTTLEGQPLFGLNEGQMFRPASNAKLFTTAVAMALLGPETRVTTIVSAEAAPDANGVVHGDIVIHGLGDPALSGRMYPYETAAEHRARMLREGPARAAEAPDELAPVDDLARQMAASGVRSLTGTVRGDSSLWRSPAYAPSWDAGDAVWGYGAAVTALTVNDSQLEMTITPGKAAGDPASIRLAPDVRFTGMPENMVTTVADPREANVDIVSRPFPAADRVVGAVALGHADTEEIAVQDPALFAAEVLAERMAARGITSGAVATALPPPEASALPMGLQIAQPVDLTPKPEAETSPVCGRDFACGVVLARHVSPTLAQDVAVTLKVSQNLHAEMMLRRLGRAYGTEGSFEQGVRVVRQWLTARAGLSGDDFFFYDGSGLSGHDLVAPRATAQLLAFAATQTWFAAWKAALPVGGEDGSLAGRFSAPELKGKVFAKTGTLGETRALAGYLIANSGRTVIFSVMVDAHPPEGSDDRAVMDRIVAAVAAAE